MSFLDYPYLLIHDYGWKRTTFSLRYQRPRRPLSPTQDGFLDILIAMFE